MSAYVVDKAHIDALVTTAIWGPTGIAAGRDWSLPFRWRCGMDWWRADWDSATELGALLLGACITSVRTRYPNTAIEDLPGPARAYWIAPYEYHSHGAPRYSPVQGLKMIDCYEYQSGDGPEWEQSVAKAFCEALRRRLIGALDGYAEAAWGAPQREEVGTR
jgi:hypothetical protein